MKRRITVFAIVFVLLIGTMAPVFAISNEQDAAIKNLLNESRKITGAPGISVAVLSEGETFFFSSGLANPETGMPADENTLWEMASVSKAFTAMGILYLEERGSLSLSDSIAEYLPWLSFRYKGQAVDMNEMKLYHFLHHTSGLTSRHTHMERGERDTLQNAVSDLNNSRLSFYPGERFGYGNENYIILGLVIEIVTGQSYESFMREQIFQPLGLTSTFANRDTAAETGRFAQGYRREFTFFRNQADFPGFVGNAPTGFLITSADDMARWMGINLGTVKDIPEIFQKIAPGMHEPGQSVPDENGAYYAAGWRVNADRTIVEHGGDSSGFSAYALLFPEEQTAIAVFSNMGHSNMANVAYSVKKILDGDLGQPYDLKPDLMQILDMVFSAAAAAGVILTVLFLVLSSRRRKQSEKVPIAKKKVVQTILSEVIVDIAVLIAIPIVIPGTGGSWSSILSLVSYSFLAGPIALMLMSFSITLYKLSNTRIE